MTVIIIVILALMYFLFMFFVFWLMLKTRADLQTKEEELETITKAQEAAINEDKENTKIKNNNVDTVSDFNNSLDQLRELAQKGQDRI